MKHQKNNKTILLVSNMYPSNKFPHYGVFVQNVEKQLKQSGFKIISSTMSKGSNKIEKLFKYILFYLITIIKGLFCKYDYLYAHYASHTALPLLIIKVLKPSIKIVMNVHGNDIVPEDKHDERFIGIVKKVLNKSDKIICPSNYFKNVLVEEYKIKEDDIVVYPSAGVNLDVFHKKDRKSCINKLGLNPDYKYIGYVSRIEKNKGWDTLLKAIKELDSGLHPNYKFIFVGSGSEELDFKNMVNDLGISHRIVKFDFLSQTELSYIYNCLELFCFPTRRKSESLGLVALEAMACECPVLAANNYGPTSYIKDGQNGVFFESQNHIDLKNKIIECLTLDKNKKLEIKINSLKTARKYSIYKIKNIIVNVFGKVIDNTDLRSENNLNYQKIDTVEQKWNVFNFSMMEKIIYSIFVLSIVIDNVNGLLINSGINLPISIGQIYRILVIMYFSLLFFKYRKNNKYDKIFILLPVCIVFCFVYYFFHNSIGGVLKDLIYVSKLFYPFLIISVVYKLYKEEEIRIKLINSIMKIYSVLVPLTIIVPYVLGIDYGSYSMGGTRGFYVSNNEINVVMICTFIYAINALFKKFSFTKLLVTFINLAALFMIGSKTSIIVIAVVTFIYMFSAVKSIKRFIIFILIIIVVAILGKFLFEDLISDMMSRFAYFYRTLTKDGNILDFLMSTRNRRIIPAINNNIATCGLMGILNAFIGIGRFRQVDDKVLSTLMELDFFDTLLWYGSIVAIVIFIYYSKIFIDTLKVKKVFEYKLMYILVFLFSLIAGHVWYSPLSGGIFALVAAMLLITKDSFEEGGKSNEKTFNSNGLLQ